MTQPIETCVARGCRGRRQRSSHRWMIDTRRSAVIHPPAMSGNGEKLVVAAHAKINLFLEVLGCRDNGYHDIRSVVVPVSLHDVVTLEPANGITCEMHNGSTVNGFKFRLPSQEENLATRAARALAASTGCTCGVHINISKHIPVGGGLGGGSADAAAVLNGLNRLWGTGLSVERLMQIGERIGCDIPALVHGGAVCIEGLGERISALQPRWRGLEDSWWLVLANPGFSVSTRDVYERSTASLTLQDERFKGTVSALEQGDAGQAAASLFNGLQDTVLKKYPLIRILRDALEEAGAAGVLMSGSGASVFGLARDEGHASQIAGGLAQSGEFPFWCVAARTLPDGVMAAHGPLEARV